MRAHSYIGTALLLLLLLVVAGICPAQESRGTITGRVSDAQSAVIPNASIQITNKAMGTKVSMTTNEVGLYSASYLIPGMYKIEVEFPGFKKYVRDDVELRIGEHLDLNIALEVGAADQSITVTGETPLLNTGSASIGETIDGRRVWELPIGHGQPFQLAGLAPGVSFNAGNATLNRPFEPTHIAGYAINGTQSNRSDITIDGIPATAKSGTSVISTYVPPTDAVLEFKVQTATFDAQFGNTEGSVINMAIKSGTNNLHGTLLYVRWFPKTTANDWMNNANNKPLPPYSYNRWGGTAGGPVYIPKVYNGKNKTFFFYVYEGIHETRPRNNCTSNCSVPTQAQWGGDFSGLLAAGGAAYQVYNPYSATLSGSTVVRQPFSGNIIPPSLITQYGAIAQKIKTFYPTTPASPGLASALGANNHYDISLPEPVRYYTHTIRADHNVSDRQRIWGRYSFYKRISNYNNYLGSAATGEWFQFLAKQWAIDDVYTLSPTTVLNARFGYNRFVRLSEGNPDSYGMDLTSLGFSSNYQAQASAVQQVRFPAFNLGGYIGTGHGDFWMPCDIISPTAILTKQMGAHSVKAGFEMRAYRQNQPNYGSPGVGTFTFDSTWTRQQNTGGVNPANPPLGLSVAALLLGLPSSGNIQRLASYAEQSLTYGAFIHDDWKVTPKLTLNIGMRWEYEGPLTERYNRTITQFDPTFVQPVEAGAKTAYAANPLAELAASAFTVRGGLLFAGVNGQPRGVYATSWKHFMPRFGFAYQLQDKTVLRGGYGIFYGFLGQRAFDVRQDGYARQTDFVATNNGNLTPATSFADPFPSGVLAPVGAGLGGTTSITQALNPFLAQPLAPYNQRWQIGIQRQLPGGVVFDAAYVGNRGTHILTSKNINATPAQYMSTQSLVRDQATITKLSGNVPNPFAGLLPGTTMNGATIARERLLQPYPEFGAINMNTNQGYSWYHAVQASMQKRFTKGYTVMGTYTFSKFMEAREYLNAQDPLPVQTIADVDTPHRFSLSSIWEIPFGKGKPVGANASPVLSRIISGWQLEGIYVFQSGRPINFANTTMFYGDIHSIVNTGARRVNTDGPWFNTAGFETLSARIMDPARQLRTFPLRFGFLRYDKLKNLDASLMKKTQITEGKQFEFRFELINAFNTPNFAFNPDNNPTSSTFGRMTSVANYARRVQYTFKFVF